jgi:hypothetical protein
MPPKEEPVDLLIEKPPFLSTLNTLAEFTSRSNGKDRGCDETSVMFILMEV